jgi:GNAT superfamily N-acetyltransferase
MLALASTPRDLPALAALGASFHVEGALPGRFVPGVWLQNWTRLLAAGSGRIWHLAETPDSRPVGFFGALLYNDINDGALVATEAFWYVLPEARGAGLNLLHAFESWAAEAGAARVMMVHLTKLQPERLGALYQRRGYTPTETHYCKQL